MPLKAFKILLDQIMDFHKILNYSFDFELFYGQAIVFFLSYFKP